MHNKNNVDLEIIPFQNKNENDPNFPEGYYPINAENLLELQNNVNEYGQIIQDDLRTAENNIDTLSTNISNIALKKQWENQNPTANFESQEITLSSDDYDYLIIFWKQGKSTQRLDSTMFLKGYGGYLNMASDYQVGSNNYKVASYVRDVDYVSDTSYRIDTCYVRYGDSTTRPTCDSNIIPVFIYSGKFLEVENE